MKKIILGLALVASVGFSAEKQCEEYLEKFNSYGELAEKTNYINRSSNLFLASDFYYKKYLVCEKNKNSMKKAKEKPVSKN